MDNNIFITCPACGAKNRIPASKLHLAPKCGRCKEGLPLTSMSGPVTVTDSNFASLIAGTKPVLIDCWAPWCGPCRMIGPIIEDLARQYSNRAIIGKLNVDENPTVSQQYGIRSIPTILLFKNGRLADTIVGAVPKDQIEARLKAIL